MTEDVNLPPLPEAEHILDGTASQDGYSVEALQAYARQAVLLERERCARLCDDLHKLPRLGRDPGERFTYPTQDVDCYDETAARIAAAIRSGS